MESPAFGFRSVSDRLGAWNLYFIAKAALFALGLIDLHLPENLLFAAALFAMAAPRTRPLRPWLGVPVAIVLAYYDSRLPGLARVVSQAGLVSGFSGAYLMELAGRFVSWKVLALLAGVVALSIVAGRFVRLDVFVVLAMIAMSLWFTPPKFAVENVATARQAGAAAKGPDAMLADFFRSEAQRRVALPKAADGAAFDVIFLHVCSLSWDDLEATQLDNHPLFATFDIVLRRFNSVSTYSGPAAIRFLRSTCGQPSHQSLYAAAPPQCLLMPGLQEAGLEPQFALNHDGHFDDFLNQVRAQGVQVSPVPLKGIAAPLRGFDNSRIYDDAAVLARWMEARAKSPAARAALYYNTISLHDGNLFASNPGARSSETYKARLAKLLGDLQVFMDELAAGGRRAVVVLIPEHGAAWRGDSAQIAGLREIPTPAITLVPVGIRVVGPDAQRNGEAAQITDETSFLAVSHIVAAMLAKPPFGGDGFRAADYTAGIPLTPFVSEVETSTVVRGDKGYLIRLERDAWKELR
ncbi:MAG: cellulose biosynthesis protein BcsG [Burkholderiales bacterium]|nr:cellulose biosynthesis protein BcsG [Burkholderiales bacterium]